MQQGVFESMNTISLEDYQQREHLLATIKNRFSTYGYKQIQTSTFEQYDLYKTITGTINSDEMIKIIDPSGKVLVLRPDVTIPITRLIAADNQFSSDEERYFYISNVFRNSMGQKNNREQTQAGIENFGSNKAELDAEVIALAIHTLTDLGFTNFKLEIGHAGFFKELLNQINISKHETEQLKAIIQAKNVSEIEPFLEDLPIDTNIKNSIKQIPLLYGKPDDVIERARRIVLHERMDETLNDLAKVFGVLKMYQADQFISFDLGLINHMNYYSDIIFQGFIENYGKPVLMGGRYDRLADQFNTSVPAIGFAFDVDSIFEVMLQQDLLPKTESQLDISIYYTITKQKEALSTAQQLRNQGYRVISTNQADQFGASASFIVCYEENQNTVEYQHTKRSFSIQDELIQLLVNYKEEL